jgi:hypothetical protein
MSHGNDKRIQAQRQAIRESLQTGEYLRQIEEVSDVVNAKWDELSANQIQALKLRADLNFKRLNKVLPDLKSIDMVVDDARGKHEQMLDMLDKQSTAIEGIVLNPDEET